MLRRTGIEELGHEHVGVVLAFVAQRLAGVPGGPDGVHRLDELLHAGGRCGPRHGEALRDVGLDLTSEAEDEATLREFVEVSGGVGRGHRVASERHRNTGAQLHSFRGGRRGDDRQERVVRGLGGERAVVPLGFQLCGRLAGSLQVARQIAVSQHGSPS